METKYCKSCKITHPITKEFWYPKRDIEFGLCKIRATLRRQKYRKEKRYYKKDRELDNKYKSSLKGKFSNLKKEAKRRKIELNLSIEQYSEIIKNNCFYDSGHVLPLYGTGLDRIDNSKGYSVDNVIPCCYNCNRIRNDSISHEEMVEVAKLLKTMRTKEV